MKLFGALIACATALTDDEIAAFKCRSGTYAQYDRVADNGGTAMNRRASSKFRETRPLGPSDGDPWSMEPYLQGVF